MPGLPVQREPLGMPVELAASALDRPSMEPLAVPEVQTWAWVVQSDLVGTPDRADRAELRIYTSIAAI